VYFIDPNLKNLGQYDSIFLRKKRD